MDSVYLVTDESDSLGFSWGYTITQLVEALCSKPEGRRLCFPTGLLKFVIDLSFSGRPVALSL
jgi:hypothetical protein